MAEFFVASDIAGGTLTDGHRWSVREKGRRVAAPAFGSASRTVGKVEFSCEQCVRDASDSRNGFATRVQDVEPTLAERDYELGLTTKGIANIQSLIDTLQLMADEKS